MDTQEATMIYLSDNISDDLKNRAIRIISLNAWVKLIEKGQQYTLSEIENYLKEGSEIT